MKKLLLLILPVFILAFLPTPIFAAVDLAVKDISTSTLKQISFNVETNTDTVTGFTVAIQASSDVTISKVEQGTSVTCGQFSSTNQNNVVTITCAMQTATAVTGNIANITFTSTSTKYKFTILEDTTLDIGDLKVGTVTNVDNTTAETTTTTKDTTATTKAATTTTATKTFKDQIMDYLPYVLIGGAVILLISIVGILLSKKKGGEQPTPTETIPEVKPETTPTPEVQSIPQEAPVTPINMENVSNNLYSPAPVSAPIQDVIGTNPIPTTEEAPLMQEQPTFVPTEIKVPQQDQSSDLQAIMRQEMHSDSTGVPVEQDRVEPMVAPEQPIEAPTVAPVSEVPNTPLPDLQQIETNIPFAVQTPTTEPQTITPFESQPVQEIPSTPLPDLQQFVNLQASQTPEAVPTTPVTPVPEATPTAMPPVTF